MKFKNYIDEAITPQVEEVITLTDKQEARRIVSLVRGLRPGRLVDLTDKQNTQNAPTQSNSGTSLIIKNDVKELVFVDRTDEGFLSITYINKVRFTKRTIVLDERSSLLLKRFI